MAEQLILDFDPTPEEWRAVADWPDYEVSSFGRVRRATAYIVWNKRRGTSKVVLPAGKVLNPGYARGYPIVSLYNGRYHKQRMRRVPILVCRAFHGDQPSPRHEVAHNDGNPLNNTSNNLRWATPSENQADRIGHGTYQFGTLNAMNKLSESDVKEIRSAYAAGGVSHTYLAAQYVVSASTIAEIIRREIWAWLPD